MPLSFTHFPFIICLHPTFFAGHHSKYTPSPLKTQHFCDILTPAVDSTLWIDDSRFRNFIYPVSDICHSEILVSRLYSSVNNHHLFTTINYKLSTINQQPFPFLHSAFNIIFYIQADAQNAIPTPILPVSSHQFPVGTSLIHCQLQTANC